MFRPMYLMVLLCVPCCWCQTTLEMQILATERGAKSNALQSAADEAIRTANNPPAATSSSSRSRFSRPRSRTRRPQLSVLRRNDISLNADILFTNRENPTPDEILDIFCDEIFSKNVSVITSIKYDDVTTSSNDYILSVARHLGYPIISWDTLYSGSLESDSDALVLQIAPTIYHQCQAIQLLLERYNWTDFSVLTTKESSNDFIDGLNQMVINSSVTNSYITKKRFTKLTEVVLEFDPEAESRGYLTSEEEAYVLSMLETFIRTKSRVILLHTKSSYTLSIIEVAAKLGLTERDFMWILTSSSVGSVSATSRGTKLPPGMLAVYPNNTETYIEAAIKTAVKVWAAGVESMVGKGLHRRHDIYGTHSCSSGAVFSRWNDGKLLYNHMKSVKLSDPTGPIASFTDNGIIENFKMDLLNSKPGFRMVRGRRFKTTTWETVGVKDTDLGLRMRIPLVGQIVPQSSGTTVKMAIETNEIVWPGEAATPPLGRPEQRFFRVATKEEHPYMIFLPPDEEGQCGRYSVPCTVRDIHALGNASRNATMDYCCTGLCVELLQMLGDRMNFQFHLYEVPDGQWGVPDSATKEWNGLIRELLDEKADMVLTAFIINNQRSKAIDFSIPFLDSGITIMVSIRKGAISPYAFLEPYDFYSWILILIFSVHATGASIFIFEWLSPSGLDRGKAPTVDHKFSLFRSFWLIWAMLFGAAVSIDVPRGVSSRFLSNVWALFALVFLASYTANLAAFMITLDKYYDLSGIQDWRLMNPTKLTPHFKFATIPDSSTEHNLQYNYPNMHKYMVRYNQSSVQEAAAALKKQEIHAFIYDANVLEFTAGRDNGCELLTVGKWYAMSGYGVGFQRGSPLQQEVNEIVLDLQHTGELERLQNFWQSGACHAKMEKKDKSSHDIGILNFISAFILLAAGVLLGLILLTLEHLYFKSGRKCLRKYDKCGCCALVSLSMGKSLTFEQSVFEAIDIQRKHRCKDPICEMHLWKAKHQLDMALLKIKKMQAEVDTAIIEREDQPSAAAAAIEPLV